MPFSWQLIGGSFARHAVAGAAMLLALAGCGPMHPVRPGIPTGPVSLPCRLSNAPAEARVSRDGDNLPPAAASPPSIPAILASFCGFDIDADGTPEINSLTPLFADDEPYAAAPNGVDIVFIDPRLVTADPTNGVTRFEMMVSLAQLRQDLIRDGYFPYFVLADVYAGQRHQDGRTLLAMRRFLQRVHRYYPLKATLLVGSFPDAAIVWTFLVKETAPPNSPEFLGSGSSPLTNYVGPYLSINSQLVTTRAEIVLADLDGNWEQLYRAHLEPIDYKALPAISDTSYPVDDQVIETDTFRVEHPVFDDVFHIVEHNAVVTQTGGSIRMELHSLDGPSPEVTTADRTQPARLARPEIAVGRINPLSIAVRPYTNDGNQPLTDEGQPQSVVAPSAIVRWRRDPTLERRLIVDYLHRAHAFRLGSDHDVPLRVSSVRGPDHGLMSPAAFDAILRKAFPAWTPVESLTTDDATPLTLIQWLRKPAVLRGIAAHSDSVNSYFGGRDPAGAIEFLAGGYPPHTHVWRWAPRANSYGVILDPSFEGMTSVANFSLYRTIWQNHLLDGAPQMFVVHDGCEVMRFSHSDALPYNHPMYGQLDDQGTVTNGESLMFYANGLGLMARNKVFNDTPNGFSEAIRASGGRFGYGWMGYFQADAANPALDERTVDPTSPDRRFRTLQRKRSYFWNMIGDPTLKLHY